MKTYIKLFAALAITTMLGLFGQNTYATMPSTFKDENFYNCVVENFILDYPDEVIAKTGLTNEQLGKMKRLGCIDNEIADTTGLELMTSLEEFSVVDSNLVSIDISKNTSLFWLNIAGNGISSIDVSHNPNLTILHINGDVVIDTGIIPEKDGDKLKYDLSKLKFLDPEAINTSSMPVAPVTGFGIFDYCEPSPEEYDLYYAAPLCVSDNIAYDEENRVLYVNDLSALEDYPQIIEFLSNNLVPGRPRRSAAVAYPVARAVAKLKLAEPEPEPESDPDEILSPDTGVSSRNPDAAGALFPVFGISLGALIVGLGLYFNHKRDNLKLE